MDPTDTQHALSSQGSLRSQYDQLIRALMDNSAVIVQAVSDLVHQVSKLTGSITLHATAAAAAAVASAGFSSACTAAKMVAQWGADENTLIACNMGFFLRWNSYPEF